MIRDPIFESGRHFLLESYVASHGLLLFRANRTNELPTTIDVLFRDVRAMDVRAWTMGLRIELADRSLLEAYPSDPVEMIETEDILVYRVSGSKWEGFVLACRVDVSEGIPATKTS